MYFTYVLLCSDNTFYVGCTNDIKRRYEKHNENNDGALYTKTRRPVKLVYLQQFKTLISARKREKELKGWRREKKMLLIKNTSEKILMNVL